MKSLVYGCAAAALLCGLAAQAQAEIRVQESPVHAVPVDEEDGAVGPQVAAAEAPEIARAESAAVKALIAPKAPQQSALTPDENAFFAVLGTRVTDAASAYETYVRHTTAIDPAFSGAASVTKAVKASAAYQPQQLEAGMVAYAALVALRNPAFVEGVRSMDSRFTEGLSAQPGRVMQVRGAYEAAADVAGVLRAQGDALIAAGKAITKAAYDIQGQSWSKTPVADPKAVLADAKASAEAPRMATVPSKEKLLASLVTAPQTQGGHGLGGQGMGAPDVVRGLALAAMAITGHTGDGREAEYEALLHDASSADCLKMAKMNLNQCLAVAGPQYEDVYCSGRHAVSDTGKCVTAAAAGGPAVDAAPPEAPAPRLQTADIGREQAAAYGRPAAPDAEDDDDGAVVAPPTRVAQAAPAPQPPVQQAQAEPAPRAYAQPQYQQPPAPQTYARNDYAPPQPQAPAQYPQPEYNLPQYQPQYQQQPQYAPQPQAQYQPQQYAQQPSYPQQAYPQQQPYRQSQQAYGYANQQPYYPQQGYPQQNYYGR